MVEEKQVQIVKAPAMGRMHGATREILMLLDQCPLHRSEIYRQLSGQVANTLRSALWNLHRYGLVSLDDDGHFLLTELGRKYCDDFAGGARRARALGLGESDGPHLSPPPPVQPDGVRVKEEEIKHDLQQKVAESVGLKLDLSCVLAGSKLDQGNPNALNDSPIVHDRHVTQPPVIDFRGRGGNSNRKFVPFTEQEKDRTLDAVQAWKESNNISENEGIIVGKMLSCVVFNPGRPYNQKFVNSKEEAAEFFGLSLDDFDSAIGSLGKKGHNVAYYYEIDGTRKVGLYISWLDHIRTARLS
jgi:hypothetical protein